MTVDESFRYSLQQLEQALDKREARAAAELIYEDVAGYDRKYRFMYGDRTLLPETEQRIAAVVHKITDGIPVQYAVGTACFRGRDFTVASGVLIPRPETAALVDLIVDRYGKSKDCRILDIGTGSGCIAVSLALDIPFSEVCAIDISKEALAIAQENAKHLKAKVLFEKCDILTAAPNPDSYDVIVSNPPYIRLSEAKEMESHVLEYEPHTALFVKDEDPLVFYRAIAKYAATALVSGGGIFFEINRDFSRETEDILKAEGFVDVQSIRDYCGNYRYTIARKA